MISLILNNTQCIFSVIISLLIVTAIEFFTLWLIIERIIQVHKLKCDNVRFYQNIRDIIMYMTKKGG